MQVFQVEVKGSTDVVDVKDDTVEHAHAFAVENDKARENITEKSQAQVLKRISLTRVGSDGSAEESMSDIDKNHEAKANLGTVDTGQMPGCRAALSSTSLGPSSVDRGFVCGLQRPT